MKDRIIKFLTAENKSSAQFAEEIGVQPSGVSHILSGRNNPSLDFVMKMLTRYSFISTEWLLFGKEPMYRGHTQPTLFDGLADSENSDKVSREDYDEDKLKETIVPETSSAAKMETVTVSSSGKGVIDRIVFFYSDNSFEEFSPSRKD